MLLNIVNRLICPNINHYLCGVFFKGRYNVHFDIIPPANDIMQCRLGGLQHLTIAGGVNIERHLL